MKKILIKLNLLLLWSLLASLFLSFTPKKSISYDLVIYGATIIDTFSGQLIKNQSIAVTGQLIVAIEDDHLAEKWNAKRRVNANGRFVIPSLWDMHVHFGGGESLLDENKDLLPLFIAKGVTTVRDCSADISPAVFKWKSDIATGKLEGPTIFSSGPKLEGINSIWPGDQEVSDRAGIEKALDSLQKMNADFVKITDNALSPELFETAVSLAHDRGFKVSGHIPFSLRALDLSKTGLSTVEHLSYLVKAGSPKEIELIEKVKANQSDIPTATKELAATFDAAYALTVFKELKANGTAVVPTLIGTQIISYLDEEDHSSDFQLSYLGKEFIKTYDWRVERANKANPEEILERKRRFLQLLDLIPILKTSGIDILAGTDTGFLNSYIYPGFSLHQELKLFVEGGLTPLEALQSSVVNGPKFFGLLDSYGSVEVGKKADLLLLNSNPLISIAATEDIFALIRNGSYLEREKLDLLLSGLAKKYASEN